MKSLTLILLGIAYCDKIDKNHINNLLRCGLKSNYDVWRFNPSKLELTLRVNKPEDEKQLRKKFGCEVVLKNIDKIVKSQALRSSSNLRSLEVMDDPLSEIGLFSDYLPYDGISNALKQLYLKFKNNENFKVELISIGKSTEGRDLWVFSIYPKKPRDAKSIVFNGGIHAREWISPASVTFILWKMLNNYITDPSVSKIIDRFAIHFIPLSNPDGYEFSRTKDRYWRKNRRDNKDGTYGVDLNRNWDDHWSVFGTTNRTDRENYCGPSSMSEPEVKAVDKFLNSLPSPYGGIDFHSYGQKVLRNWGFVDAPHSKNEIILKELGDKMRDSINSKGYKYTSEVSVGLYPASGAFDDYMASKYKMVTYTVELCPDSDDPLGFLLPSKEIIRCATATYDGTLTYANFLVNHDNIPSNELI
ncbi:hypothetical protein CONCODRAFT_165825 [Conidiobolus coronatus NRRL 28638]|uniref:Peptidase M14 domain-containing protein n=1 Tax=Conidiobolus coronatus (strain ATCC 28846 / CBS 209.66 / NRRL 28638) TaxID=796925 RepID=A0A137P2X2_CONC2|nr:hypothetical protein CONCODRAFT_165825 [Conidiobolus coronatus NRRL 28638]|eukprot:KXN69376.1 hypothetical protein CONCODRAFT_165825 [Conidiobolus coronatus NRRL 28638]